MDEIKFRLTAARAVKKKMQAWNLRYPEDHPRYKCSETGEYDQELRTEDRKLYRLSMIKSEANVWDDALGEDYDFIAEHLKNKGKLDQTWYVLDISPDEKRVSLASFVIMCHAFFKKNAVIKAEYSFEQRGEPGGNPIGSGFHIHSNTLYARGKSELLRKAQLHFKSVADPSTVKVRELKTEKDLRTRRVYMSGIKAEKPGQPSKAAKAKADPEWRQANKLLPMYYIGEPHIIGEEAIKYEASQ